MLLANHERLATLKAEEQCDEQRKLDQLVLQLREEKTKAEEMQQKIESLRAIDRDMLLRRKSP